MKMRLGGFSPESVVDGPGIRAVVFAQGCPHHCRGCHNPESWDFTGGYEMDTEQVAEMILENRHVRGVTFGGGEPFAQAQAFAELARRLRPAGLGVVAYSGYTFEQLLEMTKIEPAVGELLEQVDILIDGSYREEERDLSLAFRGSRNQRIIDVPASLVSGRAEEKA